MLHAMNQEPTTQPIGEDDDAPATKGDLNELATKAELQQLGQQTDTKFDAVLALIKEESANLRQYVDDSAKQTRDHFDAIAENIHVDVAGANKDEVELLNNQVPDHEERIADLEKNKERRSTGWPSLPAR